MNLTSALQQTRNQRNQQTSFLLVFLSVLVSLTISPLANADEIEPFKATYTAYHDDDDVGEATLHLIKLTDDMYQMEYYSSVSKFFLSDKRYERSVFKMSDEDLMPVTYEYIRRGTGPNKALNLNFDAQNQQIIVNEEETMPWRGELDNQLFRIDLSRQLANDKRKVTYDFINYRGEKRQYRLEVLDTETLTLPYGEVAAIKVKINRESKKRVTFAWFSEELDWSLVRLQQFKEGKEQGDIRLKSFAAE